MNYKDLKKDQDIYFINEVPPMQIKALDKRFAICTRQLHRRHDKELLHFEVKRGAYLSFTEAFNALKADVIYTILDFKNNNKGTHNMIFNMWDFTNTNEVQDLLNQLNTGEVELSKRNTCKLLIDWTKTITK